MPYNTDYAPDSALSDTEKKLNQEIDAVTAKIDQCLDLLAGDHVNLQVRQSVSGILEGYKTNLVKMKYSVAQIDETLQTQYVAQFRNLLNSIKIKTDEYLRYCLKLKTAPGATPGATASAEDMLLKRATQYFLLATKR